MQEKESYMCMNMSEHKFIHVKRFNPKLVHTVHSIELLCVEFYNELFCEDDNRFLKRQII